MDMPKERQSYHPFSQGRPKARVFQTLTTYDVAPGERYEYWTGDVIRNFEIETPDERQRQDFKASVTSLATMAGEMHYAESDAYGLVKSTYNTFRGAVWSTLGGGRRCAVGVISSG